MTPESRAFGAGAQLPGVHEVLGWLGHRVAAHAAEPERAAGAWRRRSACTCCCGARSPATRCARSASRPRRRATPASGRARRSCVAMALSGALAGAGRRQRDRRRARPAAARLRGRRRLRRHRGVSLIGRNHPLGIVLAALLFGALYQGGAELAFEIPGFSRDMVFTLQGLIVLFAGAMAQVAAPWLARPARRCAVRRPPRPRRRPRMDDVADRHAARLDAARVDAADPVRAGRRAERTRGRHRPRPRRQDAAHRLRRRPASAPPRGSLALALLAALAVGVALSMLHGYACVSHRGDQVVMGMAITMTAAGLTVVLGIAWFEQGGQTPPLPDAVRLEPLVHRRRRGGCAACRWSGRSLALGLLGHNALVYGALALVAGVWWLLYRTRFGLRLRAAGENPAMVDAAGVSVLGLRYQALACNGVLARAGRLLPGAGAEPAVHPEHDRRPRLHGAGGDDLRQVAPGRRAAGPACCSAFSTRWRSACRAPCCRLLAAARCRCRRSRRCPTC